MPEALIIKVLDVLESWMVRRMLVRAATNNDNQTVADMVALLRKSDRALAGDVIGSHLAGQTMRKLEARLIDCPSIAGCVARDLAWCRGYGRPSGRLASPPRR